MSNVYLGRKVKDTRYKGLDTLKEINAIREQILKDYRRGVINKKVALGRLLLLYRLSMKKNNRKIKHLSPSSLIKIRTLIKRDMRSL